MCKLFGGISLVLYNLWLLQSGAAYHSLGFEDENLGSFFSWWAATVATYYPRRPGELHKFLSSKPLQMIGRLALYMKTEAESHNLDKAFLQNSVSTYLNFPG